MNLPEFDGKISIITATYNAEKYLPRLIESLRNQEDKNFEWIVADGASTDKTLEILNAVDNLNIKITSQEDFGIYDALNRGIKACKGEFYLVMGADDVLYPNGIKDYKAAISDVDVVTATVQYGKNISKANRGPAWLSKHFHYVSCHAVGSLYRRDLHEKFGFYSRRFPIAADQLFMLTVFRANTKIQVIESFVGMHDDQGVSHADNIGTLCESYRVMLELGFNKYVQTLLFIWRLLKRLVI